jgi:hypothetical protein
MHALIVCTCKHLILLLLESCTFYCESQRRRRCHHQHYRIVAKIILWNCSFLRDPLRDFSDFYALYKVMQLSCIMFGGYGFLKFLDPLF